MGNFRIAPGDNTPLDPVSLIIGLVVVIAMLIVFVVHVLS